MDLDRKKVHVRRRWRTSKILFHPLIKQVTLIFHHDDQSMLSFLGDEVQELVLQLEKTRQNPMATDPLMRSMIENYW